MKCIIRFFLGISLPMLMTNGVPAATEPAANPPKRVARVFDDEPQSEHADWHRLPAGDTLRLPFDKLWAVSGSTSLTTLSLSNGPVEAGSRSHSSRLLF